MRYFRVRAKCGHVGRLCCIWIDFAVVAESKKEAAQKVKQYKRVKKNHKDVISQVEEINFESYMQLRARNDSDAYLHCKNVQQQKNIDNLVSRIEKDEWNIARICGEKRKRVDCTKRRKLFAICEKEAEKRIAGDY